MPGFRKHSNMEIHDWVGRADALASQFEVDEDIQEIIFNAMLNVVQLSPTIYTEDEGVSAVIDALNIFNPLNVPQHLRRIVFNFILTKTSEREQTLLLDKNKLPGVNRH